MQVTILSVLTVSCIVVIFIGGTFNLLNQLKWSGTFNGTTRLLPGGVQGQETSDFPRVMTQWNGAVCQPIC